MMQKIIVIGKSGQLAKELNCLNKSEANIEIICFGRNELDITNIASIKSLLQQSGIIAVINASAYTAVDMAESNAKDAELINHIAVSNLAKVCSDLTLPFVHISTDYVFSGDKGTPYLSNDPTDPNNVYGITKAAGEKAILKEHPEQSVIIRTSWVYSSQGNNFVKTMLRLMEEKDELSIIDDQIGSPTWAKTLASACVYALKNKITGVYHWTDEGVASWYDFAKAIQSAGLKKGLITKKIKIKPIPSEVYPTPAKRPHYSVLDKVETREIFKGINNEHWELQLNAMLDDLKE